MSKFGTSSTFIKLENKSMYRLASILHPSDWGIVLTRETKVSPELSTVSTATQNKASFSCHLPEQALDCEEHCHPLLVPMGTANLTSIVVLVSWTSYREWDIQTSKFHSKIDRNFLSKTSFFSSLGLRSKQVTGKSWGCEWIVLQKRWLNVLTGVEKTNSMLEMFRKMTWR